MRGLRLQFWLHVMDLFAWLDRSWLGARVDFSPLYLWAVARASSATDWVASEAEVRAADAARGAIG